MTYVPAPQPTGPTCTCQLAVAGSPVRSMLSVVWPASVEPATPGTSTKVIVPRTAPAPACVRAAAMIANLDA
jgi:hypothetical protein